ncbi:hypothetical protein [Streptomyces sp. NPDC008121]|uniref:hypothetical protein n=1 Tax=Streptomyces sp. NPDC008121 TaxID=3364809 RepID=UPI0036EC8D39
MRMVLFSRDLAALALSAVIVPAGVAHAAPSKPAEDVYCQEDPRSSPAANAVVKWACAQVEAQVSSCEFSWDSNITHEQQSGCSFVDRGFVYRAWQQGGAELRHFRTSDMWNAMPEKFGPSSRLPGDVVFTTNLTNGPVTIYLGGDTVVQASVGGPLKAVPFGDFVGHYVGRPG